VPDDIELGFNAVQSTVGLVAELAGVQVATENQPPVANPQSVVTSQDTSKAITLSGSDPDADPLTYSLTANPSHGTLTGTAPSLVYTPNSGYQGPDAFTFTVNDGELTSAPATVSITVTAVNQPPVATPQSVTLAEDTSLAITLSGSDGDNDVLAYQVASNPLHGLLSGTAPNLTYTPVANYHGPDSFSFRVNDGKVNSSPATVGITVTPVNDQPVANGQTLATPYNTPVAITLSGSDVDGDTLTYQVGTPSNGSLSGTAPNLTYTPATGYGGADSFTFTVSDGTVDSAPATVSITVNPAGPVTVFFDDFETNQGWTRNPSGTDTATLGLWERADPQSTSSSGAKQLGSTASGSYDLVTGPLAGSSAGSHDVDGGLTSIRSPSITLPAGQALTLSLKYYMAHGSNSSSADYLRVKVVGTSTTTVLQELGANNDDDAAWASFSGSLNSFAGQTIRLLVECADASGASLVECAIDDVRIVAQ
jgi:hypothetical protein